MKFAKDSIAEVFLFLNLRLWGSFLGHTEFFFFFKAGICSNWLQPFLQFVMGILCREWPQIHGDGTLVTLVTLTVIARWAVALTDAALIKKKKKKTLCITPVNHSLLFIHQQLKDVDKRYSGVVRRLGLTEPLKNNLILRVILEDSVH